MGNGKEERGRDFPGPCMHGDIWRRRTRAVSAQPPPRSAERDKIESSNADTEEEENRGNLGDYHSIQTDRIWRPPPTSPRALLPDRNSIDFAAAPSTRVGREDEGRRLCRVESHPVSRKSRSGTPALPFRHHITSAPLTQFLCCK